SRRGPGARRPPCRRGPGPRPLVRKCPALPEIVGIMSNPGHSRPSPEIAVRPVALVTGAARRIGRAIALELAGAGFDIALHHRGGHPQMDADAEATACELRQL